MPSTYNYIGLELDTKENQLNGKRLLWLASHPASAHQKALDTYNSTLPGVELGSHMASARDLQDAATANKLLNLPSTSLGSLHQSSVPAVPWTTCRLNSRLKKQRH
jgi:hypothetical protein